MLDAVEDSFVYVLKSKLVCEGNYVSSSLSAIVCDCVDQSGLLLIRFILFCLILSHLFFF